MMSSEYGNLLKESVADFVARRMSVTRVRALRNTTAEYDRALWKEIAALGWLGICVPEQYGGMSLGLTEAAAVAEGLARVLAPEPFAAATALAAGTLVNCNNDAINRELLPAFVSGERVLALAWQETSGTLDVNDVAMQATPFEGGFRLSGRKRYIAGAAGADTYIVSARNGPTLVLACVDRDAPGASLELDPLADGRHFGSLQLQDVVVPRERVAASGEAAASALSRAIDEAAVLASAELYGVMSRTLEMSVEYMKTRVQFGHPIGSFQALQHRAVDLYIQQQLASAVLEQSLRELDARPAARERSAIASRVKARCSEAGVRLAREAIQIHGAIGFTDEYDAGLYLKRALVLAAWLGNAVQHRRRYAALTMKADA
jgi:alkylation response protein AidB-like acyl-CoA dehydrogenase